jgi:hypothetical protein
MPLGVGGRKGFLRGAPLKLPCSDSLFKKINGPIFNIAP